MLTNRTNDGDVESFSQDGGNYPLNVVLVKKLLSEQLSCLHEHRQLFLIDLSASPRGVHDYA